MQVSFRSTRSAHRWQRSGAAVALGALAAVAAHLPARATEAPGDELLSPPPPPPLLATATAPERSAAAAVDLTAALAPVSTPAPSLPLDGAATPQPSGAIAPALVPTVPVDAALQRPTSLALLDPQSSTAAPRYAITPERRALLNTIRFAEGTWARGEDLGYRIMFGGGLMPHLERHPDRVNHSGGYASAAAGAYQFMPFTWERASRALQLEGFGPHVQDQAALFLIERRGALSLADQGQFSPDLAARLAPEWASFPTLAGNSYYGQPVQRYAVLRSFYERNLAELRASLTPVQPVATKPACEPVESLRCRLEALESLGPRSRPLGG